MIIRTVAYLCGDKTAFGGSASASSGPVLGPQAQRRADIEASFAPGTCRVCNYANKPSDQRCYQCGNII